MYSDKSSGNASRARGFTALLAAMLMALGLLAMPSAVMAFAYVANTGSNTVSVVDMSTAPPTVVATVPVGNHPIGVALSPDGKRAYVTNSISNNVSVIDTTMFPPSVIATVAVGNSPSAIAVTPDGKRVYVANVTNNTVSVIGTTTAKPSVIATVAANLSPGGVAIGPAGNRVYIANIVGIVTVIDNTKTPPSVISTITTGAANFGIAVTPDGKRLYVTNSSNATGPGNVSVIDTMTASVVATVAVGVNPLAVAIIPDGTLAYVANSGSNTVSVINTTTSPPSVVFIIPVGLSPQGIGVTAGGKQAYVTNSGTNTVSVIDVPTPTFVVGNEPVGVAIGSQPICALFLSFSPTLSVVLGHTANTGSFTFQAGFTLSSTAPAINPVTQPVTIQADSYTATIPPGSFKHGDASDTFAGVINGVSLNVTITPAGTLRYTIAATGTGANFSGIKNPVPVGLTIDGDCGKASVTAKITP